MKKFRAKTVYDLSHIESTPVHREDSVGSLRQFRERESREEEAARIAAEQENVKQAEIARRSELATPATRRLAAYWSQPLKEIATNGIEIALVDLAGEYEVGPRGDDAKEIATWKEFKENLALSGCTLSDAGGERLGAFLCSLAFHRGVSLTSARNWQASLTRLHSLGVFQPGELTGYQTSSQTPSKRERHSQVNPLSEIESLNLDNREENRRAKEIATNDFFGREMAHVVDQWESWLFATFNYILTDDARKAAGQWWERNPTANPLRGESWTALRLNLVKQGVMPASCKTSEELLNETIEKSSERSDSYETRRSLRQAIRDLAQ